MNTDNEHDVILEVRNLYKVYASEEPEEVLSLLEQGQSKRDIREETGAVVGVDDVSFEVKRGEFFVLMGLSGSGKSTLCRCLIRLIEPTTGQILLDGDDIAEMSQDELRKTRRSKLAMVFQHYGLLPHKTVLDNVQYGLKVRGISKKEREAKAREAIARVGLEGWETERPGSLSGGMQQRVGLARALAQEPEIMLMDEPFSGLDPLIRGQMQDEFATLQDEDDITTVFVTHDLDEALRLGDRIAIMRDGEIVQIATPAELVTNPADEYVERFVAGASPARFMRAEAIMDREPSTVGDRASRQDLLTASRQKRSRAIFVTKKDGTLVGAVSTQELVMTEELGVDWHSLLEDVVTAQGPTPLEDLLPMAVGTPFPIAIVDGKKRLLGIVNRQILLETLAQDIEDEEDEEEGVSPGAQPDQPAADARANVRQPITPGD